MQRVKTHNLGYLGNPRVLRDGVEQSFSAEEVKEYARCMADPVYFIENHMKVIHKDHGLVPFKPYPYQRKMLKHFTENRFSIILACRQSGKSISSVGYILWCALFHSDKTIAILANKGTIAREMLSRVALALEHLPFFLQPGCRVLNKGNIAFSNNSEIIATGTSSSSIRGLAIDILFLDEFAFVEKADKFYESTYPVISSGKTTKVIITSTMNGIGNMFYNLWEGAIHESNDFKPFRVDWWDVPGRDEEWKRQTIANTSQLQFDQEFGNNALGHSGTLIAADKLISLTARDPLEHNPDMGLSFYERPCVDHKYIMIVDTGKGRGQDYSTFSVIDVSVRPFQQVCVFRSNMIPPLLFPDVIVQIGTLYNEALVIIESNDVGQVVCNGVYYDHEYENTFVESAVKRGGVGLTMTKKTKRIGCRNLKDLIEAGRLEIHDAQTIVELACFAEKGSSYEATEGNHDDLVMTLVAFSWFASSEAFGDMVEELDFKTMLYAERAKEMEDGLIPAGFFPTDDRGPDGYDELVRQQQEWNAL